MHNKTILGNHTSFKQPGIRTTHQNLKLLQVVKCVLQLVNALHHFWIVEQDDGTVTVQVLACKLITFLLKGGIVIVGLDKHGRKVALDLV